jgi:hypothetical protein
LHYLYYDDVESDQVTGIAPIFPQEKALAVPEMGACDYQ